MRRRPQAEAYSDKCIKDMRVDHFDYIKRGATTSKAEVIKGDGRPNIPNASETSVQPMSERIREEDAIRLGYTAGCPGCAWHRDKLGPHRGHSTECRAIIEGGGAKHRRREVQSGNRGDTKG